MCVGHSLEQCQTTPILVIRMEQYMHSQANRGTGEIVVSYLNLIAVS